MWGFIFGFLILIAEVSSADSGPLSIFLKTEISHLNFRKDSPMSQVLLQQLENDPKLGSLYRAGDYAGAKAMIQSRVDQEVLSALSDGHYAISDLAELNVYLEHHKTLVSTPGKKAWWNPKSWLNPKKVFSIHEDFKKRIGEAILADPKIALTMGEQELRSGLPIKELRKKLAALDPASRIRFYGSAFDQQGNIAGYLRQEFSAHLLEIVSKPVLHRADFIELLKQYELNWDPEVAEQLLRVFKALDQGSDKQSLTVLKEAGAQIGKMPPEQQLYFRGYYHEDMNGIHLNYLHKNLLEPEVILQKEDMLNGEIIPRQDWAYDVFHQRNLSFKPPVKDELTRSLLAVIESRLQYSGKPPYRNIGPWVFSKLIKENPRLAAEYAESFMRHEFIPQVFGLEKMSPAQAKIVLRGDAAPQEALRDCLRYLKDMHDPELEKMVFKAYRNLPESMRNIYQYSNLKDEIGFIFKPESFEYARIQTFAAKAHANAAQMAQDPEVVKYANQYFKYLADQPELLLSELANEALRNLMMDTNFPMLFGKESATLQKVSRKMVESLSELISRYHLSHLDFSMLAAQVGPYSLSPRATPEEIREVEEKVLRFIRTPTTQRTHFAPNFKEVEEWAKERFTPRKVTAFTKCDLQDFLKSIVARQ